ncbi:MAG: pyridoxal-phosphate dependent enzyme [Actinomycetia bacterium]|nr:pyridoxal-phosphate dependent enzyme [Actinomycetes bacterium]
MAVEALDVVLPSPLVEIDDERLGAVRLLVKRDDLIHPVVSGNKWRKLRYALRDVEPGTTVLSFGGAFSNHLRALAAWGRYHSLRTVGVVRGEEQPFNDVLAGCVADGMELTYLDRRTYRRKTEPDVVADLRARFAPGLVLPEGGTTVHAVRGCAELVAELNEPFGVIATAVGTGGTLAGLAAGIGPDQRAIGISALRGARSIDAAVDSLHEAALGRRLGNWAIDHERHHGGFARRTAELDTFVDDFAVRHGVRLEWVYVAKLIFAIYAKVAAGEFDDGSTVVAVVTGPALTG